MKHQLFPRIHGAKLLHALSQAYVTCMLCCKHLPTLGEPQMEGAQVLFHKAVAESDRPGSMSTRMCQSGHSPHKTHQSSTSLFLGSGIGRTSQCGSKSEAWGRAESKGLLLGEKGSSDATSCSVARLLSDKQKSWQPAGLPYVCQLHPKPHSTQPV